MVINCLRTKRNRRKEKAPGLGGTGARYAKQRPCRPLRLITGQLLNFAYVAPRDGTITSIYGFMSVTSAVIPVGSTVTVHTQLYESASPTSNLFAPIVAANVNLAAAFSSVATLGTVATGSNTGLSIPVTAGLRYVLVVYTTATGSLVTSVAGYISAGMTVV